MLLVIGIAGLFVGISLVVVSAEVRSRSEVSSARRADAQGRQVKVLLDAMSVMPPGYLSKDYAKQVLNDAMQGADIMMRAQTPAFVDRGRLYKKQATARLKEIESQQAGSLTLLIATKNQVEVVREAIKVLHAYSSRILQKNPGAYRDSDTLFMMLEFGRVRIVSDYYNSLAQGYLKAQQDYRARLAFNRSAEIIEPWKEKLEIADKLYRNRASQAERLADAQPQKTGADKNWESWEEASNWQKKPQYD